MMNDTTANPRDAVNVLGDVDTLQQHTEGIIVPHLHDILSGRGAGVNRHPGNIHYRNLVRNYKMDYSQSKPVRKKEIIKLIVDELKEKTPPGRFLRLEPKSELWDCISTEQAMKKTGQALRVHF